jgi:hypothetical protein
MKKKKNDNTVELGQPIKCGKVTLIFITIVTVYSPECRAKSRHKSS